MARGSRIRRAGGEEPGVDCGSGERQGGGAEARFPSNLIFGRREAEQGRLTKNKLRNLPMLLGYISPGGDSAEYACCWDLFC